MICIQKSGFFVGWVDFWRFFKNKNKFLTIWVEMSKH